MKKAKALAVLLAAAGVMTGCGKFAPEETAVSIGKHGDITAAVIDTLDEDYYSAEELKSTIDEEVAAYNSSVGVENIEVDKYEAEEGHISLFMKYASYMDYAEFNQVAFYTGDIAGAKQAGYDFDTTFQKIEKGEKAGEAAGSEATADTGLQAVVFEEAMGVEVPGNILYVSSNVEVTGKKSAKLVSQGEGEKETESETEKETSGETEEESQVAMINPTETSTETEGTLGYIIYE